MIEAIYMAHDINLKIIDFINQIVAEVGKEKHTYESCTIPEELFAKIKEIVPPAEMEEAVFTDEKQVRDENIREITARVEEALADNEELLPLVGEAIYQYQKKTVRKMILKDHKRPDGRAIDQIRPLAAEVDLIPRVHGSAMFTRGQTQICTVTTLAPMSEVQRVDGLDENITEKRICISTISRPILLERQSQAEVRDVVRSDTVRLQSVHYFRFFLLWRSSRMQSVWFPRLWNPTDPHPRPVSVRPRCP